MAGTDRTLVDAPDERSADDCHDVEKILSAVVKRRKTIPMKCMEINRQISAHEISRLENAKIIFNENEEKENFRKAIRGFRQLQTFQFNLYDLHEAEQKLEKYFKRAKEINMYLEKRRSYFK